MRFGIAELIEGVFMLREGEDGLVDADFVLTLRTPHGVEQWDFGWSAQGIDVTAGVGTPRERFDLMMRTMFEDHMYDLRPLGPDRSFDELPIRMEIPSTIARRIT